MDDDVVEQQARLAEKKFKKAPLKVGGRAPEKSQKFDSADYYKKKAEEEA